MINRTCRLGILLGVAALAPASVSTQGPAAPAPWTIGDVFVGVGRFDVRPGEYLVLDPAGEPKNPPQILVDPTAGATAMSVGCAVAPAAFGQAMFATSYYNRTIARFANTTGAASVATPIAHPNLEAIESIVFDTRGHYYVGGITPRPKHSRQPRPPVGFIFKFDSSHNLAATYEVPGEERGADWIDLATDQTTIYYTSEGSLIHVYNPTLTEADRYRRIQVTDGGRAVEGSLYAIRLLPPRPNDPTLAPSGFLIASNGGILRVAPDGSVVRRYWVPALSGQYFALNVTPDGQSFWTATFQNEPDWADYCAGGELYDAKRPELCVPEARAGKLVRFHIPSGAITAGPIDLGVDNAWGMCVMGEYTAAANTCYETGRGGTVPTGAGQPVPTACRVPEICGNGVDDDADGLGDNADADCVPPRAPAIVAPPDQEHTEGDTIAPIEVMAQGGSVPLTFSAANLPPGLSISAETGVISGTVSWLAGAGVPYTVTIQVTDGVELARATFRWTVHDVNGPPALADPGTVTRAVGVPTGPIPLALSDPDHDTVRISMSGAPAWLTLSSAVAESPAYELSLQGVPPAAGTHVIELCASDVPSVAVVHEPVCRTLTLAIANRAPLLTVTDQHTLAGTPVTLPIAASDPDGHPLTWAITGLPEGLVFDAVTGVISGTPLAPAVTRLVSVTVTDGWGGSTTKAFTWTISSNRPPACSGAAPSQQLWPPNSGMVPVTIAGVTDEDGDALAISITAIQQDEPVLGPGSGSTDADGRIDGVTAWIRAERTGVKAAAADGRIYEIFYAASDGRSSCSGSVLVGILHDRGTFSQAGESLPADSGLRWDSLTGERIR